MTEQIATGEIHHLRLTVTDLERSRSFYTNLLGFTVAVESPEATDPQSAAMAELLFGGIGMIRGNLLLGLRPVARAGDAFDEGRAGLDHLSFSVPSRDDLVRAAAVLVHPAEPTGPATG